MSGQIISKKRPKLFLFKERSNGQPEPDLLESEFISIRNLSTGLEERISVSEAARRGRQLTGLSIVPHIDGLQSIVRAKTLWSLEEIFNDKISRLKTVRLEIGGQHEPDFVVDFLLKNPGEIDIAYCRANLTQLRAVPFDRIKNLKIVTDLRVSDKLFKKLFITCRGAGIISIRANSSRKIRPFSSRLKSAFVNSLSRKLQLLIVQTLFSNS